MDVGSPAPVEAVDPAVRTAHGPPRAAPPRETPARSAGNGIPTAAERLHSSLKSSVTTADVDARIEIHRPTRVMTVTMYDRHTGEVLREFPSRHLLDVIAAVTGVPSGMRVDASS
jgi:uncharacterized FlaG/YvyC family protein